LTIMRRWGLIHKGQGGITLVELLVAIVLVGLISLGITQGISQVLVINARASNHMIAVRQVQQAGDRVSKDVLQSLPAEIDDDPGGGLFLVLGWDEPPESGDDWYKIKVEYRLVATDDELKKLEREYKKSLNGEVVTSQTTVVARYIDHSVDPDDHELRRRTRAEWDSAKRELIFTVTATVGNGPQQGVETRVYKVEPRPTGEPEE